MNDTLLWTALAVAAGWLLVLSVLFAAVVRHLGTMQATMLGIAAGRTFDFEADGPELMSPLPDDVRGLFARSGVDAASTHVVLFVSTTCDPCIERAEEFSRSPLAAGAGVVVLATGRESEHSDRLRELLAPAAAAFIPDPDAHETAKALNINSTPFAFRVANGAVVDKTYVSSAKELEELLKPALTAARG